MRFPPDANHAGIDVLTLTAIVRECATFEASMAGGIAMDAIRGARDKAMKVVRNPDVTQREADRANGALDVLEHIIEHGFADYKRASEGIGK